MRVLYETLISKWFHPTRAEWNVVTDMVAYSILDTGSFKREPTKDLRVQSKIDDSAVQHAAPYDVIGDTITEQGYKAGIAVNKAIVAEHGKHDTWTDGEQYGVGVKKKAKPYEDMHPTGPQDVGINVWLGQTQRGTIHRVESGKPGEKTKFHVMLDTGGRGHGQIVSLYGEDIWFNQEDCDSARIAPSVRIPVAAKPVVEPRTDHERMMDFFGGKDKW